MLRGNIRKCAMVALSHESSHSNRGSGLLNCWTVELWNCRKRIFAGLAKVECERPPDGLRQRMEGS